MSNGPIYLNYQGQPKFVGQGMVDIGSALVDPYLGGNILSSYKAELVDGIMVGYEIYIANIIVREIRDQATSTKTSLTFSYLLT